MARPLHNVAESNSRIGLSRPPQKSNERQQLGQKREEMEKFGNQGQGQGFRGKFYPIRKWEPPLSMTMGVSGENRQQSDWRGIEGIALDDSVFSFCVFVSRGKKWWFPFLGRRKRELFFGLLLNPETVAFVLVLGWAETGPRQTEQPVGLL